jgi:NACHT domain/WD domain, G-beta repeat
MLGSQFLYKCRKSEGLVQTMSEFSPEDEKCLRDLCLTNPNDDMIRIERTKGGLLEDSYMWILSHQDFINWRDQDKSQLLWIKGDPGKGKTMLLIGVVKELQKLKSTHDPGLLSYFFCQGTDSRLNHATAVLRGLICQLLIQQQSLFSYLRERYNKGGQPLFDDVNAFDALSDIFKKILHDPSLRRVYLIVDALDECESGWLELLQLIVQNVLTSTSRVKWLVSSRNRPDIEVQLGTNDTIQLSLELNAVRVSRAVYAYIEHKVSKLAYTERYDTELQKQVRDELCRKANNTFLWVALVCKELEGLGKWGILQFLQKIPSDLKSLYDRMIGQIRNLKGEYPTFCLQVLVTSTLAYRPFHLLELAALVDLRREVSSSQEDLKEIIHRCGSFLTLQEDTVHFIHQSAKDYLSTSVDHLIFPSTQKEIHCGIVSRSLDNMNEKLQRDIYDLRDPGISIDEVNSVHPDPLAQIRYACVYWIRHLCEIDNSLHDKVGLDDNGRIHEFLKKHFLHWLEALSLTRSISMGVVMIRKLEGLLAKNPNTAMHFLTMTRDANRFILYNRFIIENSPLQVYASALVFCPTTSKIRMLFQNEIPRWISKSPLVDENWSSCLQTLEGHTRSVNSVAFSHNGQRLASCSDDQTVRIWDAETGALQQTLKIGASLSALSFSSDDCNLITELGCIALDQSSSLPIQTPNWSAYCLYADRSWITWNGKKVLWLPLEYRPICSMVRQQTIAIGCASGRVLLIAGNT